MRKFAYAKFCENKILAKWRNHVVYEFQMSQPVGFLLLRHSVLFTVESLSLLYLLVLLYLDLYVLGDDALISPWSFMQTKYICVWVRCGT